MEVQEPKEMKISQVEETTKHANTAIGQVMKNQIVRSGLGSVSHVMERVIEQRIVQHLHGAQLVRNVDTQELNVETKKEIKVKKVHQEAEVMIRETRKEAKD